MATRNLENKDSYTVGWIAALEIEHAAAVAMLDEEHGKPLDFVKPSNDPNTYAWGRIGVHNIVIAGLPAGMYGQIEATATASHMISSFPQIRLGLMVGIAGGIPRPDDEVDIRLGDVVVSQPSGTKGGVAQYDVGKATADGKFELRGFLNAPPLALLKAVAHLKSQHERRDSKIPETIRDMLTKNGNMAKPRPGPATPTKGRSTTGFLSPSTTTRAARPARHATRPRRSHETSASSPTR
jgi:nucleoside phosphorylase